MPLPSLNDLLTTCAYVPFILLLYFFSGVFVLYYLFGCRFLLSLPPHTLGSHITIAIKIFVLCIDKHCISDFVASICDLDCVVDVLN